MASTPQILSLFGRRLVLLGSDTAEKCKNTPERDQVGVKPPTVSRLGLGGAGGLEETILLGPPKPQRRGRSPGNVTTEPGQDTSLQCPPWKYSETAVCLKEAQTKETKPPPQKKKPPPAKQRPPQHGPCWPCPPALPHSRHTTLTSEDNDLGSERLASKTTWQSPN